MATRTATLSVFKKSLAAVLTSSAHYLQGTPTLAVLDSTAAITEDTTVTGDEFLSELTGYAILREVAVTTPVFNGLLFDGDDSGLDELTDIGSGETANKILLLDATGTPATSRLWGIGTFDVNLSGDTVDDNVEFGNGLINFDG